MEEALGLRTRYGFRKLGVLLHPFIDGRAGHADDAGYCSERKTPPHLVLYDLTERGIVLAGTAAGMPLAVRWR